MGRDERWFRRYFETAADQGAAPAAPEPTPEGADTRYAWPDGTDPEIASRYRDPVELARAKREGDAAVTRATQEAAQYRAELDQYRAEREAAEADALANRDPLREDLHQVIPDDLARNLSQRFERDPQGAYELAVEAERLYGPDLKNRVMAAWSQVDYHGAMTYFVSNLMTPVFDERFQSYEESLAERLGPTLAHATMQMSDAAVAQARSQAPDFDQYEERIEQMVDPARGGNPALIVDVMGDVQASADRLLQLRDLLWAQDERQKQLQAGQAPTATPEDAPRARPRQATISNGSAPRPSNEQEAYAAQVKASMKGVRARTLPGE